MKRAARNAGEAMKRVVALRGVSARRDERDGVAS